MFPKMIYGFADTFEPKTQCQLDAEDWLSGYDDTIEMSYDENHVYPLGRKMHKGVYRPCRTAKDPLNGNEPIYSYSQIESAGFTISGPYYNGPAITNDYDDNDCQRPGDQPVYEANSYGLKSSVRIPDDDEWNNNWANKTSITQVSAGDEASLVTRVIEILDHYRGVTTNVAGDSQPVFDYIDQWYLKPEEKSGDVSLSKTNKDVVERYFELLTSTIYDYETTYDSGTHRPTGLSEAMGKEYYGTDPAAENIHEHVSLSMPQVYMCCYTKPGYGLIWVIKELAEANSYFVKDIYEGTKPILITLNGYNKPKDGSTDNPLWVNGGNDRINFIKDYVFYQLYILLAWDGSNDSQKDSNPHFNIKISGYTIYTKDNDNIDSTNLEENKLLGTYWKRGTSDITKAGLDKAFMWGDVLTGTNRNDLTLEYVSGPTINGEYKVDVKYNASTWSYYDLVTWKNIKYNNSRYLIVVCNESYAKNNRGDLTVVDGENVHVKITGFPECLSFTEIVTGDVGTIENGEIDILFTPNIISTNRMRVYKIDATETGSNKCSAYISASELNIEEGDSIAYIGGVSGAGESQKTYEWAFTGGDITESSLKEPTVTYASAGAFNTTLLATNNQQQMCSQTIGISVIDPATICSISADKDFILTGNTITYTGTISGGGTETYDWIKADGTEVSDTNPLVVTYTTPGIKTVTMNASADGGPCTETYSVEVVNSSTLVNITTDPIVPIVDEGNTIDFTGTISGTKDSFAWAFGGGVPSTSASLNAVTVTYNTAGSYTTVLNAVNTDGQSGSKEIVVEVRDPTVTCGITVDTDNIIAGTSLVATGTIDGTGTKVYNWTATGGDPSASTDNPVTITYDVPGNYNISLSATLDGGAPCVITKGVVVTPGITEAAIRTVPDPATILEGETIRYVGSTTGITPKTYSWSFSGGVPTSAVTRVVDPVTYATKGTYTTTLSTTNGSGGTDVAQTTVIVNEYVEPCIPPPTGTAADTWLAGYDSTDEDESIGIYGESGIAPQGGVLALSVYSTTNIDRLAYEVGKGCTMVGPTYSSPVPGSSYIQFCKDNNVKTYARLRTNDVSAIFADEYPNVAICQSCNDCNILKSWNIWYGIIHRIYTDGINSLQPNLDTRLDYVLNEPDRDEVVAIWYGYADDANPHDDRCPQYGWTEIESMFNLSTNRVIAKDTAKVRPVVWSANGNPGESSFENNFLEHAPAIMQQDYWMNDISVYDYSTDDYYRRFRVIYKVRYKLKASLDVYNSAGKTNKYTYIWDKLSFDRPGPVIISLGAYAVNLPDEQKVQSHLEKIAKFDFWACMVARVTGNPNIAGINIYTGSLNTERRYYLEMLLDQIQAFTNYDLHKAWAWGDLKTDITLTKYDGAYGTWQSYKNVQPAEDGIQWKCILYKEKRYLLMLNVLNEIKEVTVSNLPDQYLNYVDIESGISTELDNDSITFNIGALDYKCFVFSKVICDDDDGGGGGGIIIQQESNGCVSFPATDFWSNTDGDAHAWTPVAGTGMQALPESTPTNNPIPYTTEPILAYKINFNRTGIHYIWVRGKAVPDAGNSEGGNSDSVFINDTTSIRQDIAGFTRTGSYTWQNTSSYNIKSTENPSAFVNITQTGEQYIYVWMREDGFTFSTIELHPLSTSLGGNCTGDGGGGGGGGVGDGIVKDPESPTYWNFRGQKQLLLGSLDSGSDPFLDTLSSIRSQLDKLQAAGGNYCRCTLAMYKTTPLRVKYPFAFGNTDNCDMTKAKLCFDLGTLNTDWFNDFKIFLREANSRDIVVSVELWDTWYLRGQAWTGYEYRTEADASQFDWLENPWQPANTISYVQSETNLPNTNDPTDSYNNKVNIDFWRPAKEMEDVGYLSNGPVNATIAGKQKLLDAQKLFVQGVLDVINTGNDGDKFENVLIEICNESPADDEGFGDWIVYWARFVKARCTSPVTHMPNERNLNCSTAKKAINAPNLYDFADMSQNETYYRAEDRFKRAVNFCNTMKNHSNPRPVNNIKTYRRYCITDTTGVNINSTSCGGASCGSKGNSDNVSIDKFIYQILAGGASCAFHPVSTQVPVNGVIPPLSAGIGLSPEAVKTIRVMRAVDNKVDLSGMTPLDITSSTQWPTRTIDEHFATGSSTGMVIYFSSESNNDCVVRNTITDRASLTLEWYNVNTGSLVDSRTSTVSSTTNISLSRPSDRKWVCVITGAGGVANITGTAAVTLQPVIGRVTAPAGESIEYVAEDRYWSMNGVKAPLFGGTEGVAGGSPWILTGSAMQDLVDDMVAVGGNFMRCTLADYQTQQLTSGWWIEPFLRDNVTGKYDLDQWDTAFFTQLKSFADYCEINGVAISVELFDPWHLRDSDSGYNFWSEGPWCPDNNITPNYTKALTGLPGAYTALPYQVIHPFYDCVTDPTSGNAVVLEYTKKFIAEVIDTLRANNNVFYQMDNESSAPVEWVDALARYVKQVDNTAFVTDMRAERNFLATGYSSARNPYHAIENASIYTHADISQCEPLDSSDERADALRTFWHRMGTSASTRPINNVKIYSWFDGCYGNDPTLLASPACSDRERDALDRFFMHFMHGIAVLRFHKELTGEGLKTGAKNAIRALRRVVSNTYIDWENMVPAPLDSVDENTTNNTDMSITWRYRSDDDDGIAESYAMRSSDCMIVFLTSSLTLGCHIRDTLNANYHKQEWYDLDKSSSEDNNNPDITWNNVPVSEKQAGYAFCMKPDTLADPADWDSGWKEPDAYSGSSTKRWMCVITKVS